MGRLCGEPASVSEVPLPVPHPGTFVMLTEGNSANPRPRLMDRIGAASHRMGGGGVGVIN